MKRFVKRIQSLYMIAKFSLWMEYQFY